MMNFDIDGTTINRTKRHLRTNEGVIFRFAAMFDASLNATSDANACAIAIYKCEDGLWKGVDARIFHDHETGAPPARRYSTKQIECDAFNRHGRFFRLTDGGVIRFVATLGADLNLTDRSDYGVAIVKLPFDNLYRAFDVTMFDSDPDLCEGFH
jgi:hypothetical protein